MDAGTRPRTWNGPRKKVEGEYSEEFLADDAAACWLAERVPGGDAVGYLADRLCEADSLPLESMYVRERFRGHGAGARLAG